MILNHFVCDKLTVCFHERYNNLPVKKLSIIIFNLIIFQDKEIHILLEDQQKINHFARLNNRLDELREDIKAKNNEIQTLKDASDDLMMLDDDEKVITLKLRKDFD